jgi:hypothetical protein
MKKIVAIVDRGITDKTPVIIFPHEVRILQELHGESAVRVIDAESALQEQKGLFDQLSLRQNIPVNVDEEWDRCLNLYGMHPEIKMTVCQFIYGGPQDERWRKLFVDEKPLDDCSLPELRKLIEVKGIKLTLKPVKGQKLTAEQERDQLLYALKEAA